MMNIKDMLGITKIQQEMEMKIALEKLHFLASEMQMGNDRPTDLRFWKEELSELERLDQNKSFLLKRAKEAYELLFQVFLSKNGLQETEETVNE